MNCLGRFQDSGRGKSWKYEIKYISYVKNIVLNSNFIQVI